MQVCLQSAAAFTMVEELHNHHNKGQWAPNSQEMEKALGQAVKVLPHTYPIFDALDECPERKKVLDFLKVLSKWKVDKLKVLVTSRPLSDIKEALDFVGAWRIPLQSHLVDGDINTYVRSQVLADKRLRQHLAVQDDIEKRLTVGAAGMYGASRQVLSLVRVVVQKLIVADTFVLLPGSSGHTASLMRFANAAR